MNELSPTSFEREDINYPQSDAKHIESHTVVLVGLEIDFICHGFVFGEYRGCGH